jgi:hypothetical protein
VQAPNLRVAGQVPPDFFAMFGSAGDDWGEARRYTSVWLLRSTSLVGSNPPLNDAFLASDFLPKLREWGTALALDVTGATLVACGRDDRLAAEIAGLRRILDLGGQVSFLSLQSPLSKVGDAACGVYGQEGGFAERISDIVHYARAMSEQLPDVEIGLIDAMPAKGWAYADVYRELVASLVAADLRLSYLHLDFPAENAAPDWSNLRQAEELIRNELGLQYGLLYISRTGGAISNVAFRDNVLAAYRGYRAAGGRPDHLVLTSWYRYPDAMLPEDDEDGAPFMNLARDFARLGGVTERPA